MSTSLLITQTIAPAVSAEGLKIKKDYNKGTSPGPERNTLVLQADVFHITSV